MVEQQRLKKRIFSFCKKSAKTTILITWMLLASLVFSTQQVSSEAEPTTGLDSASTQTSQFAPKTHVSEAETFDLRTQANFGTVRASTPQLAGNRLSMPAIGVNSPVYSIGINSAGEIDVPTSGVGLWDGGAQPGNQGNVFLDGHVYGVFANLRNSAVGQVIELSWNGTVYKYQITGNKTYELAELNNHANGIWRNILRSAPNGRNLTIMTCAGYPVGSTYSHRTVITAAQI